MSEASGGVLGRIVVGVDGSASSIAALEWAATYAELTNRSIDAVMTWEWPIFFGGFAVPLPGDFDPATIAQTELDQALATVRTLHVGIALRPIVVEGNPSPKLVEASKGADLLVVGSRGHGEFTGMLLGSVSEHCVANAHCPVLVLRERS